jgi:uncharacterized iron-regulated membrane protein
VDTQTLTLVVIVVVLLVAAGLAAFALQRRQVRKAQDRFGPEYERVVEEAGGRRAAAAELREREKRVKSLELRPLEPAQRDAFAAAWRDVQADFVDDPATAVGRADDLLGQVMGARGYPVADFDQRAADLSVEHPHVVQNYRAGHDIALRHARGEAGTEDLRQAMIHYRDLFDELTATPVPV